MNRLSDRSSVERSLFLNSSSSAIFIDHILKLGPSIYYSGTSHCHHTWSALSKLDVGLRVVKWDSPDSYCTASASAEIFSIHKQNYQLDSLIPYHWSRRQYFDGMNSHSRLAISDRGVANLQSKEMEMELESESVEMELGRFILSKTSKRKAIYRRRLARIGRGKRGGV